MSASEKDLPVLQISLNNLQATCGAKVMFDGEFASLKAIEETDTIKVPKPIAVLQNGAGTTMLVMEHLELKNCSNQAALGTQLAR